MQLLRAGAGAIGFAVAVLLHELGHFFAFLALGFEGIDLRYASVEWSGGQVFWNFIQSGNTVAASAFAEPWQVAVATGAGPAMTYLAVVACVLLTRGLGPSALILAVGLSSPLRSLAVAPILGRTLSGQELTAGLDETRLAALTNTSVAFMLALAVTFLVAAWWLLVRAVPPDQRRQQLAPVLGGIVVGGPVWLLWAGPWLLS
ncbi:MAG: hypothetical protein ACREMA_09400 [Longimicrobiales bacterium]